MSEKKRTYLINAPRYSRGVYSPAGSKLTVAADYIPSKTWTLVAIDGKPCSPDGKFHEAPAVVPEPIAPTPEVSPTALSPEPIAPHEHKKSKRAADRDI